MSCKISCDHCVLIITSARDLNYVFASVNCMSPKKNPRTEGEDLEGIRRTIKNELLIDIFSNFSIINEAMFL